MFGYPLNLGCFRTIHETEYGLRLLFLLPRAGGLLVGRIHFAVACLSLTWIAHKKLVAIRQSLGKLSTPTSERSSQVAMVTDQGAIGDVVIVTRCCSMGPTRPKQIISSMESLPTVARQSAPHAVKIAHPPFCSAQGRFREQGQIPVPYQMSVNDHVV